LPDLDNAKQRAPTPSARREPAVDIAFLAEQPYTQAAMQLHLSFSVVFSGKWELERLYPLYQLSPI